MFKLITATIAIPLWIIYLLCSIVLYFLLCIVLSLHHCSIRIGIERASYITDYTMDGFDDSKDINRFR